VSDAGTPAVSDPGAALVAAVRQAGHVAVPVPGPSSAVAALSVAGDAQAGGFHFVGFLSARSAERASALKTVAASRAAQVLFEAPHRIEALAQALAQACPARTLTLCRELTKQFETIATMPASALPGWLVGDTNRVRGEFALVLHAVPADALSDAPGAHDTLLKPLLAALPLKQAVALAAEVSGAPRNALYARALALKHEDAAEP
jgi:16S rRNA (cytidine1402-2'-O)-methyltransferase